jgi:hypothetical protein
MSLVGFAIHTMTVTRPARVRDHGAWVDDWDNATVAEIGGCVVFPGVSDEQSGRVDAQEVAYTVLAPEGTDVRGTDKVRVDLEPDMDLAVHGRPRPIPSPSGALAHVQIELREWKVL